MTLRRDAGAAGRDDANWRFRQKGTEGQSVGNDTNIGADADQLNFINLFLIVFFRKIPGKLGAAKCFFTENGARTGYGAGPACYLPLAHKIIFYLKQAIPGFFSYDSINF